MDQLIRVISSPPAYLGGYVMVIEAVLHACQVNSYHVDRRKLKRIMVSCKNLAVLPKKIHSLLEEVYSEHNR